MALRSVKKVAVGASDVGGLKSSRYEKLQVSYGSIEASSYDLLDTIVFSDVPSQDIVRATIVAHDVSPVTLKVYPGTLLAAEPLTIGNLAAPVKLSYVIEYFVEVVVLVLMPTQLMSMALGKRLKLEKALC